MTELYALFAYRLGSRADAEDLTQERLERAFPAWARFRASVNRRTLTLEDEPGVAAARMEPDRGLVTALARLSEREREIIALRFGVDLSGPDIAALTGLSLANVSRSSRGP